MSTHQQHEYHVHLDHLLLVDYLQCQYQIWHVLQIQDASNRFHWMYQEKYNNITTVYSVTDKHHFSRVNYISINILTSYSNEIELYNV